MATKKSVKERIPGVLFTVSNPSKLTPAGHALLRLFDEFSQKLASVDNSENICSDIQPDVPGDTSVSDEISRELAALNATKKSFKFMGEVSRGMGLITLPKGTRPSEFLESLLSGALPASPPMFISRVIPEDYVCAPNSQSFESVILPILKRRFDSFTDSVTWKLVYEKHGLTNLTREALIEMVHAVINEKHEVSVHEPEVTILVHLTIHSCGVAIVSKFEELSEFNLRKLIIRRQNEANSVVL
jgi:hypothetical protein